MAIDPTVLTVLADAVQKDPENVALRMHLADLYMQAAQPAEALGHLTTVLARQPDHADALKMAAAAAEAAGDKIRAHGYRNLYESISWNRAKGLIEEISSSEPAMPEITQASECLDEDEEDVQFIEETLDEVTRVPLRSSVEDRASIDIDADRPDLTLEDVKGLEEVKRRLNLAFLGPMRNPDLRKLYGKSLKGGLLLYGPPGCGKTFLARAVAGELGAKFISVGLTDVVDMWLGESEKNLHQIFETARHNKPIVLFFDEIDALGRKRSLTRDHAGRTIINQLLAEMDGMNADNEGIYMMAATNHPWDVDSALRRPGRFDRTLLVLPPDPTAREAIVRHHLKDRPVDKIDYGWIASKTEDYSGADLAHLCDSAAEFALEESIRTGNTRPISMRDVKSAMKEVRPTLRPWFESARNHAVYANEGGLYDDLLDYLRKKRML